MTIVTNNLNLPAEKGKDGFMSNFCAEFSSSFSSQDQRSVISEHLCCEFPPIFHFVNTACNKLFIYLAETKTKLLL